MYYINSPRTLAKVVGILWFSARHGVIHHPALPQTLLYNSAQNSIYRISCMNWNYTHTHRRTHTCTYV